ncbi:hypothetical protein FV139_01350 [Parahaliea maris]|uniref:Uncharacterized protein n=1 Tax=Parahaliea maris TaxID=2716870 RepID=A0A5C9A956_9GAMM|nr:hypothetical protein [Parahaliea maris]TXS96180.1 hypothetical protein FV139_01350 [Parahaliea maris]
MTDFRKALAVFSLLTLAGCTRWNYQLGSPLAGTAPPAQGQSMAEVLTALGPPLRLSSTPTGYVMGWEAWRIQENSVGFSLGAMGADFLSVDWGDARIAGQFMVVSFDAERQVTGAAYAEWDNDGGGGTAVQPFVGLADVVEVEDLLDPLPQTWWGGTLLQRLPEALNAQARPDMGSTGIQQRGTPNGIGQQSLELD